MRCSSNEIRTWTRVGTNTRTSSVLWTVGEVILWPWNLFWHIQEEHPLCYPSSEVPAMYTDFLLSGNSFVEILEHDRNTVRLSTAVQYVHRWRNSVGHPPISAASVWVGTVSTGNESRYIYCTVLMQSIVNVATKTSSQFPSHTHILAHTGLARTSEWARRLPDMSRCIVCILIYSSLRNLRQIFCESWYICLKATLTGNSWSSDSCCRCCFIRFCFVVFTVHLWHLEPLTFVGTRP